LTGKFLFAGKSVNDVLKKNKLCGGVLEQRLKE